MSYRIARLLIRLIIKLAAKVKITGYENVVPLLQSPALVVSNHLGRLDAILVYYFLDRKDITLLVAEKYQKVAFFRWMVKVLDAVWVDRFNADLGAMRIALNRLKAGHVLAVAPEGTRSQTGALIEGRAGASYLAARSGVWVVPVGIAGSEDNVVYANLRRLRRSSISIQVGKPFKLPSIRGEQRDQVLEEYTAEIMCQIAALLPPQYRGFYANHSRLKQLLVTASPKPEEAAA